MIPYDSQLHQSLSPLQKEYTLDLLQGRRDGLSSSLLEVDQNTFYSESVRN